MNIKLQLNYEQFNVLENLNLFIQNRPLTNKASLHSGPANFTCTKTTIIFILIKIFAV